MAKKFLSIVNGTPKGESIAIDDVNSLQSSLDGKVIGNTAITGATKTKITYDAKGLVTGGADATTADIADSLNKRYVTDANLTVIGNTSGANTGDETQSTIKTKLGAATTSVDGYLTATDKTKLDGVATNANNYTHPANHSPSIITQDLNNRFVTDSEKSTWDAKQATLVSGTNIKTVNSNSLLGSGDLVVGGEAVNIETLTADKTLTASDASIQLYTMSADRIVNLPTTGLTAGQKITIIYYDANYFLARSLTIKVSGTIIDILYVQSQKTYLWNGSGWIFLPETPISLGMKAKSLGSSIAIGGSATATTSSIAIGFGTTSNSSLSIGLSAGSASSSTSVGMGANSNDKGTALGNATTAYAEGVSVGATAYGTDYGVSIGTDSAGNNYGAACGYKATVNSKGASTVAWGAYSKAERNREIVSTATQSTINKAQMTIQKYVEKDLNTNSVAWQELLIDGSSARLTIIAKSVYHFRIQLNAIDKANYDVKTWTLEGSIKRNASNTTSIVGTVTKVVTSADAATTNWDAQATADDTNEALKIEVKHDSANQVRYSLNIWATETRI